MKKILVILLFLYLNVCIYAQSVFDINIGIVVPEQQEDIKSDAFNLLKTKLKTVTAQNGISSDSFGTFVIYPTVNILDNQLIEGGMRNIYTTEIELSLFVKQVSNNAVFGSCSKTLKGSGRNITDAVKNAFSKINPKDNDYSLFFEQSKNKIRQYYSTNKTAMINKAKSMAKMQQYEQALALLMTYPETLEGIEDIQDTAIDIYKEYQNSKCNDLILKSKSAIATQDYETAATLLSEIDSESICSNEAKTLMKSIEQKIKEDQKQEFELINKMIDNETALESKRIDAIKSIGTEYAKNHQPHITYTQIIK